MTTIIQLTFCPLQYYGAHLGKLKAPAEESAPRYIDDGDNFYYNQEDYLQEVQKRRSTWSWNVIRPTGIIGFTPQCKLRIAVMSSPNTDDQILHSKRNDRGLDPCCLLLAL